MPIDEHGRPYFALRALPPEVKRKVLGALHTALESLQMQERQGQPPTPPNALLVRWVAKEAPLCDQSGRSGQMENKIDCRCMRGWEECKAICTDDLFETFWYQTAHWGRNTMCKACQAELIAKAEQWEARRFLANLLDWGAPQVLDIDINTLAVSPGQPITILADASSGQMAVFRCM